MEANFRSQHAKSLRLFYALTLAIVIELRGLSVKLLLISLLLCWPEKAGVSVPVIRGSLGLTPTNLVETSANVAREFNFSNNVASIC